IGAKIRSRAAVRSVRDSTTGYRYLSRLRAADGVNGIDEPLLDLNRAVVTRAYPLRKRRAFHYRIREFTLMGLEAGIERVQACLLDADGEVLSTAILQVTITRAPTGIGSLRVVPHDSV